MKKHKPSLASIDPEVILKDSSENIKEYISLLEEQIEHLRDIGLALSKEKDMPVLLEMILEETRRITNCDGRTLYMMTDDNRLKFEIVRTDSLKFHMGGTSGEEIPFYPVKLYTEEGKPNHAMIAAHAGLTGEAINIPDAYKADGFDFSGTKMFDEKTGYHSKSFLTVPLTNHLDEIIGVIQLLNAQNPETGEVIPFSEEAQKLVESLCSQAAVAITNKQLIEQLKELFEAFIKLIATAIDKKSPYTGGHCTRVPVLTMMLADAVENVNYGPYQNFSMTDEERYELYIAGWLHDCGKVATPTHVVDKGTKLETIFDRIDTINTRFEVLKRDAKIDYLQKMLDVKPSNKDEKKLKNEYKSKLRKIKKDQMFIQACNIGGEYMAKELQEQVVKISKYPYRQNGKKLPFLSKEEVRNLNIPKGTLLPEERQIINDHIVITIDMLNQLPYPKHLKNVPEFAGGHHEKLDGTGYPQGLTHDEMSPQAKIMAIADVYEALTAADRPYKDGKKLSLAMRIMGFMRDDYHIDPDLFEIFVKEGVYNKYAEEHVNQTQIDDVDQESILG
ncbi:MAG: phosphohydrolase [Candidatus Marinimicrobia bacterium]|nr:phosphohydrolase [Candidatus Neomarinimicrobiota bacterium]|tara:strand:- start:6123 stop:7802 length:1680 start_codon:yes stop_codon:yes gene_type:complete